MLNDTQKMQQVVTAEKGSIKKKLTILIGIAGVLIISIAIVFSVTAFGGGNAKKLTEQLDLGNKYLDEMDYERAIVAFNAVLEIDPKNAEAYLGLIRAYAAQGDAERIAEIYLQAAKELGAGTEKEAATEEDAAELEKVRIEAATQLESMITAAMNAGNYALAEQYVDLLAKTDGTRAEGLKAQIAEAEWKAEEERKAKEEEERKARLETELEEVGTGEVVTFGHYEQDNDTTNGAEPIEWVVLTKEADRMLVVSRYALDCRPYNMEYKDVTWETCTLRSWLNDSFYNTVFDSSEKARIVQMTNNNLASYAFFDSDYAIDHYVKQWGWEESTVRSYGANGGKSTADKVFLLSYEEAWNYFASDDARVCTPTAYAIAQGAGAEYDSTFRCWWWLRSPGFIQVAAMYVNIGGALYGDYGVLDLDVSVRPALWISTN